MRTTDPYLLLAEDDDDDVILFKSMFSRTYPGIQVVHFPDGNEAYDFLSICKPGSQPTVLLLDYKMPFMFASGLLNFLRSRSELEPIVKIVWSVSHRPEEEEACKTAGAHHFFKKPVTDEEWKLFVEQIGSHFSTTPDGAN